MRYYFAPLEGVTDSVYRRLHHQYFGGVDRYYMPFFSPTVHRCLSHKEDRELPQADSVPFHAVPQVLTKISADFLWAAEICRDRGYDEVNLNVGCPSGTVVAKGKGAGMLADPVELDRFFDEIFAASPIPVSVKTRLGIADPAEFPALLEVFNRYPIKELTIHKACMARFDVSALFQSGQAFIETIGERDGFYPAKGQQGIIIGFRQQSNTFFLPHSTMRRGRNKPTTATRRKERGVGRLITVSFICAISLWCTFRRKEFPAKLFAALALFINLLFFLG